MAKGRGQPKARGSSLLVEHLFYKRSSKELQQLTLYWSLFCGLIKLSAWGRRVGGSHCPPGLVTTAIWEML